MTAHGYVGFDDQTDQAETEARCGPVHTQHRGRRFAFQGRPLGQGGAFYRLSGNLDGEAYPVLQRVLVDDLAAGRSRLLLEASALDYISSAGVGTLVTMGKRARDVGGGLFLLRPSDSVREVFRVLGMLGGG